MVMPCSRSARRPSVSSARSGDGQAALAADPLDRVEGVGQDRLGVVEQPAHQRGLAVVDGPGRGQAEKLVRHQKYPSFLRSSMAASDMRSSARVAPRSVSRLAETSVITSATVVALESTAPVQDMSPTVR